MARAIRPDNITTSRLVLEPLELHHAPQVTRFCRLWEVARYTANMPHPYPAGCAEAFAKDAVSKRETGGGWVYAVTVADGGEVIGVIDITLCDKDRSGELGYAFAPWSWGHGYASEAARALIEFAFQVLRLDKVEAFAMVENEASERLLTRIGMRRIGERMMPAPARERDVLCGVFQVFWSQVRT